MKHMPLEDRPQDWLSAYRRGGPTALDQLRRAYAAVVSARDAFDLASGPEAVDTAIDRLRWAEDAYRRTLVVLAGRRDG